MIASLLPRFRTLLIVSLLAKIQNHMIASLLPKFRKLLMASLLAKIKTS